MHPLNSLANINATPNCLANINAPPNSLANINTSSELSC